MSDTLQALRESPDRARFNLWRRETPGEAGWPRSARPGAPNKYFMFSADTHVVEPADYLKDIEPQYRERIPHLETKPDGSQWLITEGNRPQRVRAARARPESPGAVGAAGAGAAFSALDDEDALRNPSGRTVEQRLADHAADGVDAELMFPNRGLLSWATPDPVFAMAMCRQWNRSTHAFCGPHMQGDNPAHVAGGADRARRSARRDGRDRLGQGPRLPRRLPLQLGDLWAQAVRRARVQQPELRSDVVAAWKRPGW